MVGGGAPCRTAIDQRGAGSSSQSQSPCARRSQVAFYEPRSEQGKLLLGNSLLPADHRLRVRQDALASPADGRAGAGDWRRAGHPQAGRTHPAGARAAARPNRQLESSAARSSTSLRPRTARSTSPAPLPTPAAPGKNFGRVLPRQKERAQAVLFGRKGRTPRPRARGKRKSPSGIIPQTSISGDGSNQGKAELMAAPRREVGESAQCVGNITHA